MGVTVCPPDAELQLEELLRQADQALYSAKQAGRNRVEAYSPEGKAWVAASAK